MKSHKPMRAQCPVGNQEGIGAIATPETGARDESGAVKGGFQILTVLAACLLGGTGALGYARGGGWSLPNFATGSCGGAWMAYTDVRVVGTHGKGSAMATAWIEFGSGCCCEDECWNKWADLSVRDYACDEAADGMHDWGGFDRSLCYCVPNGTMHTFCIECSEVFEGCAEDAERALSREEGSP